MIEQSSFILTDSKDLKLTKSIFSYTSNQSNVPVYTLQTEPNKTYTITGKMTARTAITTVIDAVEELQTTITMSSYNVKGVATAIISFDNITNGNTFTVGNVTYEFENDGTTGALNISGNTIIGGGYNNDASLTNEIITAINDSTNGSSNVIASSPGVTNITITSHIVGTATIEYHHLTNTSGTPLTLINNNYTPAGGVHENDQLVINGNVYTFIIGPSSGRNISLYNTGTLIAAKLSIIADISNALNIDGLPNTIDNYKITFNDFQGNILGTATASPKFVISVGTGTVGASTTTVLTSSNPVEYHGVFQTDKTGNCISVQNITSPMFTDMEFPSISSSVNNNNIILSVSNPNHLFTNVMFNQEVMEQTCYFEQENI